MAKDACHRRLDTKSSLTPHLLGMLVLVALICSACQEREHFTQSPADYGSSEGGQLAYKSTCIACHAVNKKIVGPAYIDVAKKYVDQPNAATMLVQKISKGGSGVWGPVPMPPEIKLSDEEIRAIVTWILLLQFNLGTDPSATSLLKELNTSSDFQT